MRTLLLALMAFVLSAAQVWAFSDVKNSHANAQAITYLTKHGVVHGFENNTFRPDRPINRAELVKIVVGAWDLQPKIQDYRDCFTDVQRQWFAPFICQAKQKGWVDGYSNRTFQPSEKVNRAEAAKIILNALGVAFDDLASFPDTKDTDWFAPFADTIRSRDLLDSEKFFATQAIKRGEVAEMVFRILVMKDAGATSFQSGDATNFDEQKTPAEILNGVLIFLGSRSRTSFAMTGWKINNGVWTLKPILSFNGRSYELASPSAYIAELKKIKKHFNILEYHGWDSEIERIIGEFQNAVAFFGSSTGTTTGTTTTTPTTYSAGYSYSLTDSGIGYAADFTNINLNDEAAVAAQGGPVVKFDNTAIYTGFVVTPPLNKDPVLVSFTKGKQDWIRKDYETSSDESVGYGLLLADDDTLFAVFTSIGIEENYNHDFRRFAKYGWLSEYGQGEGKQIAVIAKIDPENGDVILATFLSARTGAGDTNSLLVTGLEMSGKNLVVSAETQYAPRRVDRQPMTQKPSSDNAPYDYEIEFTPDLKTAVRAEAPGFGM